MSQLDGTGKGKARAGAGGTARGTLSQPSPPYRPSLWLPACGPWARMPLAALVCPKLVYFGCCHLEPLPCEAPEPPSSSPLSSLLFSVRVSLLAPVQIVLATASPLNGPIPKTPSFSRLLPVLPRAWTGLFALLKDFTIPLVCAADLQDSVFEVCRWDGCSLLRVFFTRCPRCGTRACLDKISQAYLLLSGSTGCRVDIPLTHYVSFSSRPC